MNSQELWNLLENSSNVEIQTMLTMCVVYLTKSRNMKLKDILKDIKNCINNMEV